MSVPDQAMPAPPFRRADATVTLDVRPTPSVCGRGMVFTATVASLAPERGTPTGTVTIRADGGPTRMLTLCDGVATLTLPLDAGTHTATACYLGDAAFKAAPPATLTTQVWRAGFAAPADVY